MNNYLKIIIAMTLAALLVLSGCTTQPQSSDDNPDEYTKITDMQGREVQIPQNVTKIVDVSDGFVSSVLYSLGEIDTVVGLGSTNLQEIDTYTFQDVSGENYSYENGMNPVTLLYPEIMNLPAIAEYGVAVNFETIASLEPDVVIVRIGFCSMNTDEYGGEEDIARSIETMESLDIPIVVLLGPPAYPNPDVSKISEEIRIIGEIVNRTTEAKQLSNYLQNIVSLVENRTKNISEEEKPEVLLFGLSPNARDSGGAGDVLCTDTMESYFIENIVHAKNAYNETGGWKILSTEQILALNPDVIVLPTDWGYHPPRELYNASYYQILQELDAVQNRRVFALPWTPYNCAKRLEYPIEVMVIAKAAYPDLFDDFKIHEWVLDFYQNVYHVNQSTAEQLRTIQWMDWTVEEDV
jgi:iron complex transport system substrate-binding protein